MIRIEINLHNIQNISLLSNKYFFLIIERLSIKKENSLQILPREDFTISQQWRSFSRGRDIIVWLAVADFLASLGLLLQFANNLVMLML